MTSSMLSGEKSEGIFSNLANSARFGEGIFLGVQKGIDGKILQAIGLAPKLVRVLSERPGSGFVLMGLSKTEVNLRRLLAAAPQQKDQAKLIHYVTTLREQLEQLAEEKTPEGLPRVSKALLGDYSEKIEAIASKLAAPLPDVQESSEPSTSTSIEQISSVAEGETKSVPSPGLRRRFQPPSAVDDRSHSIIKEDSSAAPVKLDAAAISHIEKHRKLQEDLTDEMVGLAKQLKESSLLMSKSLENTEKILDSTEKAVEDSLASTGRVNKRAVEIYSESSKTSCFTWLAMFVMICVFIMVVLLIRVT